MRCNGFVRDSSCQGYIPISRRCGPRLLVVSYQSPTKRATTKRTTTKVPTTESPHERTSRSLTRSIPPYPIDVHVQNAQ